MNARFTVKVAIVTVCLLLGIATVASAGQSKEPMNASERAGAIWRYTTAEGNSLVVELHQCNKLRHDTEHAHKNGLGEIDSHTNLEVVETAPTGEVLSTAFFETPFAASMGCGLGPTTMRGKLYGVRTIYKGDQTYEEPAVVDFSVKVAPAGKIKTLKETWTGYVPSTGLPFDGSSMTKSRPAKVSGYVTVKDWFSVSSLNTPAEGTLTCRHWTPVPE